MMWRRGGGAEDRGEKRDNERDKGERRDSVRVTERTGGGRDGQGENNREGGREGGWRGRETRDMSSPQVGAGGE